MLWAQVENRYCGVAVVSGFAFSSPPPCNIPFYVPDSPLRYMTAAHLLLLQSWHADKLFPCKVSVNTYLEYMTTLHFLNEQVYKNDKAARNL